VERGARPRVEGTLSAPTRDDAQMSELINAAGLGKPVGFSHAAVAGDTIYLGGQIASDADGSIVGRTVAEQFDQAASNLVTALRAAGGEPDDLVSLQVFVTSVAEYRDALPDLGAIWRRHFGRRYPAMGLFGVRELFEPDAKVELMGVAVRSRSETPLLP
jgi:enamine deaminase RidA (YjgF/YER057c/UK114 family)